MTEFSLGDKIIDSRDVIEQIEELQSERNDLDEAVANAIDKRDSCIADIDGHPDEGAEGFDADEFADLSANLESAEESLQAANYALVQWKDDHGEELKNLTAFAEEASNYAPDWTYGATLILDSYFVEYCQELLDDIGALPRDLPSYIVIDWERTSENLKADYTSIDIDGYTYWVR